nr:hypothetical protein [Micromonospora endophytica]
MASGPGGEHPGADQSGGTGPDECGDHGGADAEGGAEEGGGEDQQWQEGQGEHQVDHAHDDARRPRWGQSSEAADQGRDGGGGERHQQGDAERAAGPDHQLGEEIPAEVVGAEPPVGRRRGVRCGEPFPAVGAQQPRPGDRTDGQRRQQDRADTPGQ